MSTIADKFASASTQLKASTAAVALVAAATITPVVAHAAPEIEAAVSSAEAFDVSTLLSLPNEAGGLNAARESGTAAITEFNPITTIGGIVTDIVQAIATFVYNGAEFFISGLQWAANEFARFFRVGPYAEVG